MWADGITSEELLTRSARAAYERIGRGEMVTVIETSDLKDLDGDDLLNLRAGDPLIIEVAGSGPIERVLGSAQALQEKVAYLVSRGFNASVAQVFAQHYERFRQTKVPFRVRSVSFDYNVSSGVKIEAELISYVRVDGRAENFSEGDE
jgi:hypothetical protein